MTDPEILTEVAFPPMLQPLGDLWWGQVSTPSGDIEWRMDIEPDTWRPAGSYGLARKYLLTNDQRSWALWLTDLGELRMRWSPDGTSAFQTRTSTAGIPDTTVRLSIRITLDVDDGGSHTVSFYTAPDIEGPWTALGAPVTTAGTATVFDSSADVEIGRTHSSASPGITTDPFVGTIHDFQLRDGINGEVVASIAPVWTDISEWVNEVSTSRGRKRHGELFQAGRLTVHVDNSDRRFDPSNEDSLYWPNVKPTKPIRVQARYPSGSGDYQPVFSGLVDEWPIWWNKELGGSIIGATDRLKALEQHELTALTPYSTEVMVDRPLAYWPLHEKSRDLGPEDISGNRKHGKWYGAPVFEQRDPFGGIEAVNFGIFRTGLKGSIVAPAVVLGTDDFSVEFWFRTPAMLGNDSMARRRYFVTGNSQGGSTHKWVVRMLSDTPAGTGEEGVGGALQFSFGIVGSIAAATTAKAFDDGAWHHVVCRRLASGGEVWVDTTLEASVVSGSPAALTPDYLQIGGEIGHNVNVGWMDEPAIYRGALSEARIQAHYNARNHWEHDLTGNRINRFLDLSGVAETERNIDAGRSRLQGIPELEGQILGLMQTVTQSESGSLFILRDGRVRFRGRHAFLSPPYTEVQATFSDELSGENLWDSAFWDPEDWDTSWPMRYAEPEFEYAEETIANVVTYEREGGESQTWVDQASVAAYGRRSGQGLTGLQNRTDSDVSDLAWLDLQRHKEPFLEIPSFTLHPMTERNLWPVVLDLEIEDLIALVATPPGGGTPITKQMRVQGIGHTITADPWDWKTKVDVTTAQPTPDWWELGVSQLDTTAVLGA